MPCWPATCHPGQPAGHGLRGCSTRAGRRLRRGVSSRCSTRAAAARGCRRLAHRRSDGPGPPGLASLPSLATARVTAPVVVVGGGLAGMAAAARLAKSGYPVELHERSDRLGGRWAASALPSGPLVDAAPAVLGFPAPWRDLFRKSGRPLEAELARQGYALVPAEPAVVVFADGTELVWPADRGAQHAALTDGVRRRGGRALAGPGRSAGPGLADPAPAGVGGRPTGCGPEPRGAPGPAGPAEPGRPGPDGRAPAPRSPGPQRRLPAGRHSGRRRRPGRRSSCRCSGRSAAGRFSQPRPTTDRPTDRAGPRFWSRPWPVGSTLRRVDVHLEQRRHRHPGRDRPRRRRRHRFGGTAGAGGGQHGRSLVHVRHACSRAATARRTRRRVRSLRPALAPTVRHDGGRPARRGGAGDGHPDRRPGSRPWPTPGPSARPR